jgi:hypothetical protein
MNKILLPLLFSLVLFPLNIYCAEENNHELSYWEQIKKKFEEAKSDDKELSKQAKEWIEEDIKKIGDWEYKVLNIKHDDIDKLEQKLNELGNERWECFWMEKKEKEFLLFFKRPKLSYLQKIPQGQLFKLLNPADGD